MVYHTTPKMAKRKEARRNKLLRAATRIFGQKGFHAATVPLIVAAAGSSTGAFYLYFRNKEEVFAAALETIGEAMTAAINDAIAAARGDELAHMRAAVRALVQFLAENPEKARILIVESSGLGKRLESVRRRVIESHTRGVERALRALAKRLPPMDAAVAASCWVGAVYEAVFRWLAQSPQARMSPERLAEEIAGFNLRAIGARKSGKAPATGGERK